MNCKNCGKEIETFIGPGHQETWIHSGNHVRACEENTTPTTLAEPTDA